MKPLDPDRIAEKREALREEFARNTGKDPAVLRNRPSALLEAVAERAAARNMSVDDFVKAELDKVVDAPFPSPECLSPEEIVDVTMGNSLPPERALHLNTCRACAIMAEAARPNFEKVRAMLRDLVSERK